MGTGPGRSNANRFRSLRTSSAFPSRSQNSVSPDTQRVDDRLHASVSCERQVVISLRCGQRRRLSTSSSDSTAGRKPHTHTRTQRSMHATTGPHLLSSSGGSAWSAASFPPQFTDASWVKRVLALDPERSRLLGATDLVHLYRGKHTQCDVKVGEVAGTKEEPGFDHQGPFDTQATLKVKSLPFCLKETILFDTMDEWLALWCHSKKDLGLTHCKKEVSKNKIKALNLRKNHVYFAKISGNKIIV